MFSCFLGLCLLRRFVVVVGSNFIWNLVLTFSLSTPLHSGGTSTKTIRPRPRRLICNENPPKISLGPTKTN